MEKAVKERLVGGAILVVIVVLVVPALLTGPRDPAEQSPPVPGLRSVEIDIAEAAPGPQAPPVDPAITQAQPAGAAAAPEPDDPAAAGPEPRQSGESRPATTPAPAPQPGRSGPAPAAASSGWAVQVAALSKAEPARDLVASLARRGYRAFLMEYRADGRVFYRVRVGPETTRAEADDLAERLAADGHAGTVVAHP